MLLITTNLPDLTIVRPYMVNEFMLLFSLAMHEGRIYRQLEQ